MNENQFDNQENELETFSPENDNWAVGVALILVGGLFMLDTLGILDIRLTNWWAIFILIPGLSMTLRGWRRYQIEPSRQNRNTSFWGIVLILLAVSLFFNIAWSLVLPFGLIACGLYLLLFR